MPDVSKDPRYIKVVEDVRSELAVPMLLKDRCVGVFDLESPELDAFSKRDVEILTLLASQAAVAIENARLYEEVSHNEARLEKELRFAKRVQAALLPTQLPKRVKGVDVAAPFAPARELGGDFHDFLVPESNTLIVALGDVSGKGVPAALYSVFAGELVRGRTFRRRFVPERSSPAQRADVDQHHPARAPARGVLLHALLRDLRPEAAHRDARQLRRAVSRCASAGDDASLRRAAGRAARLVLRHDLRRSHVSAHPGDVFVFCSDGVSEAMNDRHQEFTPPRLIEVVSTHREHPAAQIVQRIVSAVAEHRAGFPPNDDMTVVVVKIAELPAPKTE